MSTFRTVRWRSWLENQSSKRDVHVGGSSPIVDKNFSFCNSHSFFACLTCYNDSYLVNSVPAIKQQFKAELIRYIPLQMATIFFLANLIG